MGFTLHQPLPVEGAIVGVTKVTGIDRV